MRKVMAIVLGAALALSFAGMGSDAEAKKKVKASKAKLCMGTSFDGKKTSFRCKASESCCYDGIMAKGNCVPAGTVCF